MQTECTYTHAGSETTETADSSATNQIASERNQAWQRRMAELEAIHVEISPQLEALRVLDDELELYAAWPLDHTRAWL